MAAEKTEVDAVETALKARVASWQAVLDAYRAAKGHDRTFELNAEPGGYSVKGAPLGSFDLPVGALRTKSVPDAIRLYLSAARQKQTNKEIAAGLRQGGLETTAGNFEANIAAALFRLKKAGVVLRFKDGWDLAEHYPDHIRNKLEDGSKPKSKGSAKRQIRGRRARAAGRVKAPRNLERRSARPASLSLDQRVLAVMTHSAQHVSPKQIAENLKEDPKLIGMAFARLTRFSKVTKCDDGLYAVAHPNTNKLKAV
jgi:hypothetical protein